MIGARRSMPWLSLVRYHNRTQKRRFFDSAHAFPPCLTCCKPTHKITIEDMGQNWVEFRAECHHPDHRGKREDVIRVTFEYSFDDEDLDRAIGALMFFPPSAEQNERT